MGKQWKQWLTLFLGGSKITADGDCSHEIKRHLLLGRKVMTNLDSIFKSINSLVLSFLYSPTLTSIHDYWKTIALTRWTFVGKVMFLLFNMLSRLVITFLPTSKHLLISWLRSPSAVILEPQKIVCHCFPISLPRSDGTKCHNLSFLNVEF